MTEIALAKTMSRQRALQLRARHSLMKQSAEALCDRIFEALTRFSDDHNIACVWPLPGEPDLRPLCERLDRAGRRVLLPETTPKGQKLNFRLWSPGCVMLEGRWNTLYPDTPLATPEIILVPFLAFDRRLNRLGYGGGYYDRTLAHVQCPSIGFGFSWQEVDHVPVDSLDVPLSQIITERERIVRAQ